MEQTSMLLFEKYLYQKGCGHNTVSKYMRDVNFFLNKVDKIDYESLRWYREELIRLYSPNSVNSMIAALNQYLKFIDMEAYKVRPVRIQRKFFCEQKKDLNKREYQR